MPLQVKVGEARQLVPGAAVPAGVRLGRANNNLDAIEVAGRLYFAWRSAPHHFASAEARIHVVSAPSVDGPWKHETSLHVGADLREPRFLRLGDRLFLYVMELGTRAWVFEPRRIHALVHDGDRWDGPLLIEESDTVPWRPRVLDGVATFSVYRGAHALYSGDPTPPVVELWRSDDGLDWRPMHDDPVIHSGGTETDVVERPGGGLVGVTRIEGFNSYGSAVLTGTLDKAGEWDAVADPRKFDSPLLFRRGGDVLMIARRQLGFGGRYDLSPRLRRLSPVSRTRVMQGAYWLTRKRSALWYVDPVSAVVTHVADLPSRGDTSFGALTVREDGALQVFDYSSPLQGWDRPWIAGQLGPTAIHTVTVRFGD